MSAAAAIVGEKPINPWMVAFAVSIATFMEVLDTTITNVSLRHIAGSLAAGQEESTWVLTSYLVSNGIILPLSGWLAGVMGRKRFFMLCIAGFTLTSLACGLSLSMPMLVFFRLLQGAAGGGLQPTQQAIVLDAFPPEKRGVVFGVTGITMIVAPILGPTLGGWITDNLTWRWIFFMNIPVGLIALWLVHKYVRDPEHAKSKGVGKIDGIGLGLIALGLGCMQIVLDKGQTEDWFQSNMIIGFTLVAVLSLGFVIFWLLKQEDPVVDLRILKSPGFGLGCLLIFFTGFVLYGSSALLPLLLQTEFGYDATLAGMVISPGGFAVIFFMPIVGKLVGKVPAKYLVTLGFTLCTIGMIYTSVLTPELDYAHFTFARILQTAGLPFLFIPVSTLAYMKIPKEKNNKASAFFSLCRNLGGSIGIAVVISYVARQTQIHQSILSEHLSPLNPVYQNKLANLSHHYISQGQTALEAGGQAMGRLYQELMRQATILGYSDGFVFLACCMTIGIVLTCFMPKNNPRAGAKAPAGGH